MTECSRLRDTIKQRDKTIYQFTEDLRDLATNQTDVRKWPDGLRQIFKKHARMDMLAKDADEDAMHELSMQIKATRKKAKTMNDKDKRKEEECLSDIRKKV